MDMMGKPASFFKRLCSLFIDIVLVAILYIAFATISIQVANKTVNYGDLIQEANDLVDERNKLAIDAGIITTSKDSNGSEIFVFVGSYNDSSKEVIEFNESKEVKALENRYSEVMNSIKTIKLVMFAIDIFLAELPFFFIIPLCRKDGASLGKIIMKLSVVSRNDCKINKIQTTFRFLVIYLLESVFFYFFFDALALLFLPVFELAFWCFTKHKLFIHDLLCSSKVVENASSVIFESIKEREDYYTQKEIEDKEYALKRERNRSGVVDMEGYND